MLFGRREYSKGGLNPPWSALLTKCVNLDSELVRIEIP